MKKPKPRAFDKDTPNRIGKVGERKLKRDTDCVLTPGSGSGRTKGDGLHGFKRMMEKKSTTKKSIKLEREWLEKLEKQAFEANRDPVLVIEFDVMKFGSRSWAVVPLEKYLELVDDD